MKIAILSFLTFLFFACNNGKETKALKEQNDSLRAQVDSLKAFYYNTKYSKQIKTKRDSLRKIKRKFWEKESARMNMSLRIDKGALNHAKQHHRDRTPAQRKREIEEADRVLISEEKRAEVVRDSVRKYRD